MRRYIGGGLLALVGVAVLVGTLVLGNTSPKGWISGKYTKAGVNTYTASAAPLVVANTISRRFRPNDRVYDPSGVYLRYPNLVVAVLPSGRGSRIQLDTPADGYRRYYSSVGGRWGGPGGRASIFRGGGPGGGK